ncbi:spirocyclase AveC family protein [Stenotrophobium rhamnosiphilum]|uniref:DUF5135 domain-containing protein n=1 Tax=Stenotrophobium rhamnosiphilum TaxID=2029166 RepID=A0A2T5MD55_9GAMM|nr:spirocyclase AveC family protein [Stenotrophobium rhamnosiphilum]PTU30500.1 DUF5135 domain-containing protein [Stenotrophobium rhamnosiphilum]
MSNRVNAALSNKSSVTTWVWSLIGITIIYLIAHFSVMGAVSPRISNPEAVGIPRPVEFLFGFKYWVEFHEFFTVVAMVALFVGCVSVWRRTPGHPYVLMAIASTAIVWQDPIMNWAPYAVYNPQLWHWPEDWPLINMSPTVEPFIVVGYALFYFGPFFPAVALLKRLQARSTMDAFVWRKPLVSLALLILVIGFVMDMMLEVSLIRTGLYIYSQVIPFGSLFPNTPFQFPLIWESALVTLVMIPAGVLCYRDDTGRTVAEKLTQRLRFLQSRPTLATFLVMFGILNIAYFMYGAAFAAIRVSGAATAVACPYPFPEAKVYDPQGYYESEGQPGPFFEGYWNKITIGQPDGRPKVNPIKPDAVCSPKEKPNA